MKLGIEGRRALIAGGSSGIGRACAELFVEEGVDLCLVARGESRLRETAEALTKRGDGKVSWVAADLSTADGVAAAFAAAESAIGPIDILVNNGGGPKSGPFSALSDEDWANAFQLTLMNTVRLTRLAVAGMAARGWGRVVNVQSTSVKQPVDNLMLSNSIRMAVVGFAKTLSTELSGRGVTINTVAPGYAATDRLETLAAAAAEREKVGVDAIYQRWSAEVPLRRLGRPEEIAAAVVFLASEAAGYVNGVVLPVDGGRIRASL